MMKFILDFVIGLVLAINGLSIFTWGFWIIFLLILMRDVILGVYE